MAVSSSSINSLPVELLAQIFSIATHGEDRNSFAHRSSERGTFDTSSVKVPVAVSCVNRFWRLVALNTPSLWTSLCITHEMLRECYYQNVRQHYYDTSFLECYLARSQMYPLDILIDARDPYWDCHLREPESFDDFSPGVYVPKFSSRHIIETFQLLLPHLKRWRSLEILTDVWLPMHTALECLEPFMTSHGAPRLESLTLSRCNEYPSFSPSFFPKAMKDSPLFSLKHCTPRTQFGSLLPSLRHVKLQGVHVHWPGLAYILSQRSGVSLKSLQLDYHSRDVRPSVEDFHQILASNAELEVLSISGSGPVVTDVDDDATLIHHDLPPVTLLHLYELTLGYRSVPECQTVLELIHAPNTTALTLEDATHPADPDEVDAGAILTYLSMSQSNELHELKSPSPPFGVHRSHPFFPSLSSLTLSSVKSHKVPLNAFLNSLQHLHNLEATNVPLEEFIPALVPSSLNASECGSIICPCPRLRKLAVRNIDPEQLPACRSVFESINVMRQQHGGGVPLELDLTELEFGDIFGDDGDDDDDDDEDVVDMDFEGEEEEEEEDDNVFQHGGGFHNSMFDEYYDSAAWEYR